MTTTQIKALRRDIDLLAAELRDAEGKETKAAIRERKLRIHALELQLWEACLP